MIVQNRNRPPVLGTRKRGGAKNVPDEIKIGHWNVGTLNEEGNLEILLKEVDRFQMKVLGVSETHWNYEIEEAFEEGKYVILQSCRKDGIRRQGVALIIEKEFSENMTTYDLVSERIIMATFDTEDGQLTIIEAYAPDMSYDDDMIEEFYQTLQDRINSIPRKGKLILLGDFNAKVGEDQEEVMIEVKGKYGLGKKNDRGQLLLQFCAINNLVITNTIFKHKANRCITWFSPDGVTKNQIDYIITRQDWKSNVKNSRSYHSADIGSGSDKHSLVLAKFNLKMKRKIYMQKVPRRYDVAKLINDEQLAQTFKIKIGGAFEPLLLIEDLEIDELYRKFKQITNKATEEIVGFKRRHQIEGLATEIEEVCKDRRHARTEMINDQGNKEKQERYKLLNKKVKSEIKKHKKEQLEKKIENLEEDYKKNNTHNLFKMVRELEGKPTKILSAVKDKDGVKHTNPEKVLECWRNHFSKHLNTKFPREDTAIGTIPDPPARETEWFSFTEEDIGKAVKEMKNNKAAGIDTVTAEVLKAGGQPMIKMLHKLYKKICDEEQTPEDWAKMLLTPVHKKGDKLDPENYRAISLLSIPGKVFTRVLLNRMNEIVEGFLKDSQFGFRQGRGTVDAIFIIRQTIEKAKEHNVPLHFNFVDFKSAFDTIWRKALWKMLRSIGVTPKIVRIIEAIYKNTECAVVINGRITEWFKVEVGVRQGCLLSPTLFNIFLEFVMNEVVSAKHELKLNNDLATNIRYADDTTLISAIFEKMQMSTKELENACKKFGMKINGSKCKILSPCNDEINIDGSAVEHVGEFVFLGSVVPDTSRDVQRRLSLASQAFGRLKNNIWSRKDISKALKARLYRALIIPIATYAAETWALKVVDMQKLHVWEMRCLRSILGVNILNKIKNDKIRKELGMEESINDIIQKRRLKWFGHVCRRDAESMVQKAYKEDFTKRRPRGRPPKRWVDQIKADTGLPVLTAERRARDRIVWRSTKVMRARGYNGL